MTISIDQFKDELNRHDWYYHFSDDHGVFLRGERENARIFFLAKTGGDDFKRAYNEAHAIHFKTDSFSTRQNPYTPPFKLD